MQNGWFLVRSVEAANEKIVGLLRIKSEYGFENDIIRNSFAPGFGMPEGTTFSTDRAQSPFHVFASDGTFLFSVLYPDEKGDTFFILVPMALWVIAFIFILSLTFRFACRLAGKQLRGQGLIASFLCLSCIISCHPCCPETGSLFPDGSLPSIHLQDE